MDGFEAAHAIRTEVYGGVGMTIIAMTANAMQGDRERCLAPGMDDCIAKPICPAVIASVLAKLGVRPRACRE